MPNQYTPCQWHPSTTRDRLTPIQGLPPGSVDKELAEVYHLNLYKIARPCRWVGAIDDREMPIPGEGQWVSDVVD